MQDDQRDDSIMAEINMTPMVDVMLVLLIIFIITLPVIQQAVKIELPKANSVRNEVKPESVQLSIDGKGQILSLANRFIEVPIQFSKSGSCSYTHPHNEMFILDSFNRIDDHGKCFIKILSRVVLGIIISITLSCLTVHVGLFACPIRSITYTITAIITQFILESIGLCILESNITPPRNTVLPHTKVRPIGILS
jgi:hypothetical protein